MQGKAWEIAKNLLYKLHLDTKAISEATGLSQAELTKLQEEGKDVDWATWLITFSSLLLCRLSLGKA